MEFTSTGARFCGFILAHDSKTLYLPLLSVSAQVSIIDVSARVTLTQTYLNTSDSRDVVAKYIFPIPARAAVCAFEMRTQDGKVVHGLVKEKEQAKKEYDEAVSQGKWAGLLSEVGKDAFSLSVGAIPANQEISVSTTYVLDLSDGELLDQVRFQLPTYLGDRYGSVPAELASRKSATENARLNIVVDVEMTSPISKVTCPSHSVELSLGPRIAFSSNDPRPSTHFSSFKLTSAESFLDKDFVLSIQSAKLDYPRCTAESLSNAHTTAFSLTLVPRFDIAPIRSQEYIFLIDRSGSMEGSAIENAKRALLILLKSLPSSGTSFNIVSFGGSHTSLWESSKVYSQGTLDEAVKHVDGMDADYGGTEILSALEYGFKSRNTSVPTSLFLLTDGEVWGLETIFASVQKAISSAKPESFIRVFTLGIGHGASTAMCEGIARAGNGTCLMAIQNEEVAGKCARLLKASRTPSVTNLRVDWGIAANDLNEDFDIVEAEQSSDVPTKSPPATINLFDNTINPISRSDDTGAKPTPNVVLAPPPLIQQAPFTIPSIYPGTRFIVSALVSSEIKLPEIIVLRGDLASGEKLELRIPVHHATTTSPPLIHTLAARRLIQDLEDGKVKPRAINANEVDMDAIVKAAIVKLSTEYQLTSKYASFVAVQEANDILKVSGISDEPVVKAPANAGFFGGGGRGLGLGGAKRHRMILADDLDEEEAEESYEDMVLAQLDEDMPFALFDGTPSPAPPPQASYKKYDALVLSASDSSSSASEGVARRSKFLAVEAELSFGDDDDDGLEDEQHETLEANPPEGADPSVEAAGKTKDPVAALARLQSFDGSFTLSTSLPSFLSKASSVEGLRSLMPSSIKALANSDMIWATAIAAAFMTVKLSAQKDVWEGMFEKAKGFVEEALEGGHTTWEAVLQDAVVLI